MSIKELKKQVWKANRDLVDFKLVTLTWGNVSGYDPKRGLVVIKPSGVSYEEIKSEDMVVVDLKGNKVEGVLNPSSDTPIHLELYKAFHSITGIAHTHSDYATIFAQACQSIPCLGTTHADHFNGEVPLTRMMSEKEVIEDYEENTGRLIAERFERLNPIEMPAVLVAGHGPFTWGKTPSEAVANSLALEKVAKIAFKTLLLAKDEPPFPNYLLKKHFERKHGPGAYYGQKTKGDKK